MSYADRQKSKRLTHTLFRVINLLVQLYHVTFEVSVHTPVPLPLILNLVPL